MKPGDLVIRSNPFGGDVIKDLGGSQWEMAGVRVPYNDLALILEVQHDRSLLKILWKGGSSYVSWCGFEVVM